ncbi:hypothetical protein E2C01_013066 [Portunus trituberculatus]|uniref:Uncharacterized protein n=1 Tax=Portunus trituberculatus TaxID=210409 RepID=A0A5B7DG04_PORTR|nr:hypothetical protein [Portunus trituberculatus]
MRRFDDFSTSSTSSHPNTSMRKTVSGPARNGSLVVSSRSSANKAKSATNYWSGSDASGASNHALLKKDGEEKTDPNEKILMMQGEISLLRSELKRKETALETERLDHNAAIEVMESKGKEKLAKQAAEADMKLKEKSMAFDKLQGELHFKARFPRPEALPLFSHAVPQLHPSAQRYLCPPLQLQTHLTVLAGLYLQNG